MLPRHLYFIASIFLALPLAAVLGGCDLFRHVDSGKGPGPENSDCPIPIPTWTTEETNFNQQQTLDLLAEIRSIAEMQAKTLNQGGKAQVDLSAAFNAAIENRQKKTYVISQSATQAALAMRELQCAIWRKNITPEAAQTKLLEMVDRIAGVEKGTSPPAQPKRNIWDDPSPLFDEARTNIAWVILEDREAKKRYDDARSDGKTKYEAVLEAQGHNERAQETIRRFGEERTTGYIGALGH